MANNKNPESKFLFISIACHVLLLSIFIIGFDFKTPKPVIENTNQNDIISAVVLGDTSKSKILPEHLTSTKPNRREFKKTAIESKPITKVESKPLPAPKKIKQDDPMIKKDVIALKPIEKKLMLKKIEKPIEINKPKEIFAENDLLADIKKQSDTKKTLKQKALKSKFEKILREQAEASLRQQLLNEEIKVKGTVSRASQGVINKYQALIIQAISENWIVPTDANPKLYCELLIRLAPTGQVLDVSVIKTSGNLALDRSAKAAVIKASPLPVPSNSDDFTAFRQFVLKVKPENILSNNPLDLS